mgnify:CR=1 FL=1
MNISIDNNDLDPTFTIYMLFENIVFSDLFT